MKQLLLILLFIGSQIFANAQDTIRTLIISEARIDNMHAAYVELSNVGTDTIDLSKFEFGKISPWNFPYQPNNGDWLMLPKVKLAPGKSFVMAKVNDYCTKMWAKDPQSYNKYESKPEFNKLADLQIHIKEAIANLPQSEDSVSVYSGVVNLWNGSYCWYLRHHISDTDSVVVDQVNGVFDDFDNTGIDDMHDVAGTTYATGNCILIRKNSVKEGNTDFASGSDIYDSEWMVVPFLQGAWEPERAVFWTVGNHGNFRLNTLSSSYLDVNWQDKTITLPWGINRDDSIMYKFNRVPGIAWHYHYSPNQTDSAYTSIRTDDKLTVYACGDSLKTITFQLIVLPLTANDNLVFPKRTHNSEGFYNNAPLFCEIANSVSGMDTIFNFPFATRVDTLFNYLEKPSNATWQIEWINNIKSADIKTGDILKVTSKNGSSKRYYLKPNPYKPSKNANLSAITWPDIPDSYRGIFGWKGDTIPNFSPNETRYRLTVPWDINYVPALTVIRENANSDIHVNRALNLSGSLEDRTITFTVTAEDGITTKIYKVELIKEFNVCCDQAWKGEPFISQYVFKQDFQNDFLEIVNPGTETLDLSNYMLTFGYYKNANEAITRMSDADTNSFKHRYNKYIPGYKWVDEVTWASMPGRAIPDINVNPHVNPKDVFVLAEVYSEPTDLGHPSFVIPYIDIDFYHNPWNEDLSIWGQALRQWWGQKIMLFKILNDSIKQGLKAANDPRDFKLIDAFGDTIGDRWVIGGKNADMVNYWKRKPNIYKGNQVLGSSFGTNKGNSEWINSDEIIYSTYWPWPEFRWRIADGIGIHYMSDVTIFKSTITSNVYKVSSGYSMNEKIKGVATGITVSEFLTNIQKADNNQQLKVVKSIDGSILNPSDIITLGDSLLVTSADSTRSTKYLIDPVPLSDNAVLTSALYTIAIDGNTGIISNFSYQTKLKDILSGVTIPQKAKLLVYDTTGAYVPLKLLNFDKYYTDNLVNTHITIEVTAEKGNKILYHLQPNSLNSDTFITSNFYKTCGNYYIRIGNSIGKLTVKELFQNLNTPPGYTIKLFDKNGFERKVGFINMDDKLLATAADNSKSTYYFYAINCCALPGFITSNDYTIDFIRLKISGNFAQTTLVSDFLKKFRVSKTFSLILTDKNGNEKLPASIVEETDLAKVLSCDGTVYIVYTIDNTSSDPICDENNMVNITPNPTSDLVTISGLKTGDRIRVFNVLGEFVMEIVAKQNDETISFQHKSKGLYVIKIISTGGKENIYKLLVN